MMKYRLLTDQDVKDIDATIERNFDQQRFNYRARRLKEFYKEVGRGWRQQEKFMDELKRYQTDFYYNFPMECANEYFFIADEIKLCQIMEYVEDKIYYFMQGKEEDLQGEVNFEAIYVDYPNYIWEQMK